MLPIPPRAGSKGEAKVKISADAYTPFSVRPKVEQGRELEYRSPAFALRALAVDLHFRSGCRPTVGR